MILVMEGGQPVQLSVYATLPTSFSLILLQLQVNICVCVCVFLCVYYILQGKHHSQKPNTNW